jgi:hypothetical protein
MQPLQRAATVVVMAGLAVMASVPSAEAIELEDYLAESGEATYAGQQTTWCSYGGHTEFSVVSVEHAGDLVMVEGAESSQMVGAGRSSVVGGSGGGIALSGWSSVAPSDRYVMASVAGETRQGRDVEVVTVNQGDAMRIRIWFDKETGAALGSEIYDGNGELFRLGWLIDFDPNPRKIFTMMRESNSTYDVVVPTDAGTLAESVAGYLRVDTYSGPDDSIHAFYTDGLFSFSLFLIEGEVAGGPFADAEIMRVDGAEYNWLLSPTDLWVEWNSDGLTYVLVGDLPPDHLEQVLREIPRPSQGNIFSRLWRGLFG